MLTVPAMVNTLIGNYHANHMDGLSNVQLHDKAWYTRLIPPCVYLESKHYEKN